MLKKKSKLGKPVMLYISLLSYILLIITPFYFNLDTKSITIKVSINPKKTEFKLIKKLNCSSVKLSSFKLISIIVTT